MHKHKYSFLHASRLGMRMYKRTCPICGEETAMGMFYEYKKWFKLPTYIFDKLREEEMKEFAEFLKNTHLLRESCREKITKSIYTQTPMFEILNKTKRKEVK